MQCNTCCSLLKSWSDALNEYAFQVSELKYTDPRHYSRFYDKAASAFELAAKAKALYDTHREEHAIGVGLENSNGTGFTTSREFHDGRN
jgi:hypothetical protein